MPNQNIVNVGPKILASGQLPDASWHAVYTVPSSTSAIVKKSAVTNVSGQQTTLSSTLSTGGAITSLPVSGTTPSGQPTQAMKSGTQVTIQSGTFGQSAQTWTLTADAAAGATALTVGSQTPTYAYPSGSTVQSASTIVSVSVAVVPSGGSNDGTHTILNQYSLQYGDTLPLADFLDGLQPGDAVYMQCGAPYGINYLLKGIESA